MVLGLFNFIWIYLFSKCLFGFKIDTSNLPFSIIARFIPFYFANFWWNAGYEYDYRHSVMNYKVDLIIPFICDIEFYKQV